MDTGSLLSASNLPPLAERGSVLQTERFHWFTRDSAQITGPIGPRADFFASAAGQWSSQSVGLAAPGNDQGTRILFANATGRVRLTNFDQLDLLYSGSRLAVNNFAFPAALEALEAGRDTPSFVLPTGLAGESEAGRFDFLQGGWTREMPSASGGGVIEVRYGFSDGHLDTNGSTNGQSTIELLDGDAVEIAAGKRRVGSGIGASHGDSARSRSAVEARGERTGPRNQRRV